VAQTIVALTVGDRSAASSRIRAHVPLDRMEAQGHHVYRVNSKTRTWPLRLFLLIVRHRPHVGYMQKVMPPVWFLQLSRHLSQRMVFDLDDAIYLGYPGESQDGAEERSRRIVNGIAFFDSVLTSNKLIREDLGLSNDPRCVVFPGPSPQISETALNPAKERLVLWLGSPSTAANIEKLLSDLIPALPDQEFLVVGGRTDEERNSHVSRFLWSPEVEADSLRRSWAGLMPLERSEWNDRKAGYKILEYLRGGVIPVVEDSEIVRTLLGTASPHLCELVNGSSPAEWVRAIEQSLNRTRDDAWFEARDSVFALWNTDAFAKLILGAAKSEETYE